MLRSKVNEAGDPEFTTYSSPLECACSEGPDGHFRSRSGPEIYGGQEDIAVEAVGR